MLIIFQVIECRTRNVRCERTLSGRFSPLSAPRPRPRSTLRCRWSVFWNVRSPLRSRSPDILPAPLTYSGTVQDHFVALVTLTKVVRNNALRGLSAIAEFLFVCFCSTRNSAIAKSTRVSWRWSHWPGRDSRHVVRGLFSTPLWLCYTVLLNVSAGNTDLRSSYSQTGTESGTAFKGRETRISADVDKPARRVSRSVKVTIRSTIPYVRYSFLLCNSNFLFKTRRFYRYSTSDNAATWKSGSEVTQGHWKWYHSIEWVRFPISVL